MRETEKKFWNLVIRHRWKVFAAAATLLSLVARFGLRTIVSGDMQHYLLPWYEEIRWQGQIKALSVQIGNYHILYQLLIALMTYLPILPIYAIKGLSIAFDYALGLAAATGVYELTRSRAKASVAYASTIMLPMVMLNSAAWGQCDSIFTFFLVVTFILLKRGKHAAAFLMYGIAFAFKLQAVFFLPFLLFYYVWSKKISILHFLLALIPIAVISLAAVVQGRSAASIFQIYQDQVIGEKQIIAWNYPSFWLALIPNNPADGSDHYHELSLMCLSVTVVILGAIMIFAVRREKAGWASLLLLAAWMLYTCVLFLPSMHDRYAYPAVIFTLMACFVEPRLLPVALGHLILEMNMYGSGLHFKTPLSWEVMSLINIACYAGVAWVSVRTIQRSETPPEEPRIHEFRLLAKGKDRRKNG